MDHILQTRFRFFIVGIIMFINLTCSSQSIKINDVYMGKNLYVQNPFAPDSSFCTSEVYLNGVKVMENMQTSAYEIDLSGLKHGDTVNVIIYHKDKCKPKILRTYWPKCEFQFTGGIIENGVFYISTKGEGSGKFMVKKENCLTTDTVGLFLPYGNNLCLERKTKVGWQVIYSCRGKESPLLNNYSIKIPPIREGIHRLRIRYLDNKGQFFYSNSILYQSYGAK
jgi:hypothetical protein